METLKPEKKNTGKLLLVLSNILLMAAAVLCTFLFSRNVRLSQEQLMRDNFCNTVETMKHISERYLSEEWDTAASWAAYIQQQHMTMAEAMDYIRTVNGQSDCEAHFVDMDTFEAWTTRASSGIDTVQIYSGYYHSEEPYYQALAERMRKMFNGEKYVLGKYRIRESQRIVISVGQSVTLSQPDGSDKDYLLLRVVPVERMKALWLFPVNYPSAEIGLITPVCDYVIPSSSMRAENYMEFIRSYNYADDFNGANSQLAQLETQLSGLMTLKDSRGQDCYWYYSRLDEFNDLDILGYIPVSELTATTDNLSVVLMVAGILLLITLLDGAYILNINRRLRLTADIAEKASSAKTKFLSTMSHDIRTPLNAVLGMTELAQSHAQDPAYVQECLRKISLSGNHLLTLINDILEISRVESGRINITPAPFDVRELIAGLESITRSQAAGRGLKLDVQMHSLPEPCLIGDRLRLTQVYLNLLNNAVKYTEPGGSIRLDVSEEPLDDGIMLCFVIADTGIGMSPEFQQTMYDSFSRVADSRIDKIQGTGLGLAIVKRMVTLMNGTIGCQSAEGAGTSFTVRIPLAAASASVPHEAAPNDTPSPRDLSGVRILVAEDNNLNWEIISELLSDYGIRCTRAENGRECVDLLTAAPPDSYDLVLMDVQMPVLNGRDAARELRTGSRDDLRTLPIIAMTADAFAEDVQLCLDAGMDAHVAKPVEIEKVLSAIRLLLSRKNGSDGRQP